MLLFILTKSMISMNYLWVSKINVAWPPCPELSWPVCKSFRLNKQLQNWTDWVTWPSGEWVPWSFGSADKLWSRKMSPSILELTLGNWMVTSTSTKITYRNVYCALCNGEMQERNITEGVVPLSFWRVNVRCHNKTVVESIKHFSLDILRNLIKEK